jgi:tetratricopeptide (TPR) repeat protein
VLLHLAEVSQRQGKLGARYGYLVRARAQLDESNDRQGLSNVLLALGSSLMDPAMNAPDRMQRAAEVIREAMEIKRSIGDRHGVAEAFRHLGQLELEHANYPAAQKLLEQSLNVHQALGAPFNIGATHNSLAVACIYKGEFELAEEHCDRAIELFQRINDQIAVSHVLLNKGINTLNRREITRAQSLLREARRIKESHGSSWALFDLRNYLAICAMWLGEFETADRILGETLQEVDEHGTDEDRTVARSLMGFLRCFQGRLQLAALELGRARADAEELGIARVSAFCQANAAVYSCLTGSDANFDSLIGAVGSAELFHILHREIWLSLVENMARHAVQKGRDRHGVRLLRSIATIYRRFGHPERAASLQREAKDIEAELAALRS